MIESVISSALVGQRGSASSGTLLDRTIEESACRMVDRLKEYAEPMLLDPQEKGMLEMVGAVYSLATGKVCRL